MKRIAILTAGADAPGANAAIRSIVRTAYYKDMEVLGVRGGFAGLLSDDVIILTSKSVSGILPRGGTILGTSRTHIDESQIQTIKEVMDRYRITILAVLGDRETMSTCELLSQNDIPVLALPLTIDNDINGTDETIGFDTAVTTIAEALDKLHTTAEAHHRVMVVETMGGATGWLALYGGISGGADFIVIPEVEVEKEKIVDHIYRRRESGRGFSIVVVAEGTKLPWLPQSEVGVGHALAKEIQDATGMETRITVLGHQQRGGSPTVQDRMLATQMGIQLVNAVKEGTINKMVAFSGGRMELINFDLASQIKTADKELYNLAEIFY
ncbi:6-phosphofructokinase [Coprothermobacter platensis]|uniref:6-phosphofructokinase n=1 Tax=Coprothermobacter platensis TaxID=108819 RepID=UPI000371ECFC|nr:ATP-dependent 6-phosphofructokinase [Coprothermobacter platensis]